MTAGQSHDELALRRAAVACRPLYLDPQAPTRIELEGPALSIRRQGQAERLLPLRRVSRILANERSEFSTAALLACADRGIAVVFVDAEANVKGRLLGTAGERQALGQRLVDLLDRPDWRDLYGTWLHAQQRRAVMRVQRRLGLEVPSFRADKTRMALDRLAAHYAGSGREAERCARWLDEQLFAWMLHHLQTLGLTGLSELGHDGHPDLVTDLTRLLHWYAEAPRLGWLRRRALWIERTGRTAAPIERRDMIRLYQRHAGKLSRFGRELTNRLHRWLVDLA